MREKGMNIGASAGYSGLFSVSAGAMHDDQKKSAEEFTKETKEQKIYSMGKSPPADGDAMKWMADVVGEPQPQRLRLEGLDNMNELRKYLAKKSNGQKVLENLKKALGNYCQHLQSMNSISSCAAPDPDPAFPVPEPASMLFPGRFGDWGRTQYCGGSAYKGYAINFELRIEPSQGGGELPDDTALNTICLDCNTGDKVCSTEGRFGNWHKADGCNKGFTGAQFETEGNQGSEDDTGGNDLKLKCSNGDWLKVYGSPGWGTWSDPKDCPKGSVICGLRTKVEDYQGAYGDDSMLNGVEFKCCQKYLIN